MKKLLLLLAAGLLAASAAQAQVTINMDVDSSAVWNGYVNAFELDGTTFATGFPEATVSTMSANFTDPTTLTLSPNTRLYDDVIGDAFWVNPDLTANKVIEANFYQEFAGIIGDTINFDFDTIANGLPAGYTAIGFIKVLDADASWATTQFEQVALTSASSESLSLVVANAGAGSETVQVGFAIKGVAVAGTSSEASQSMTITAVPEPATFALLGGFAALGLVMYRRRKQA